MPADQQRSPLTDEDREYVHSWQLEEWLEHYDLDDVCREIAHWRYHDCPDIARQGLLELLDKCWEHRHA